MEGRKRVIALGFFDGLHVGHKALLDMTKCRAEELGATPSVISFDAHPDKMVRGEQVELINSSYDRADMLRRIFGIEDIIFLHFDKELMSLSWEKFVDWLVEDFGAIHLMAGYDFHFGKGGEGNPEKLVRRCRELDIGCDIIPRVTKDGITISSTYIRDLLKDGKMMSANEFLGHPHVLTDFVRCGYRFGRKLGLPTINMCFPEGVLVPAHGVYSTKVHLGHGVEYMAVTNVGVRPTVGGESAVTVESHILDFSGNLYGKQVRVEFYRFIRPEIKFSDAAELSSQIRKDVEETREFFAGK